MDIVPTFYEIDNMIRILSLLPNILESSISTLNVFYIGIFLILIDQAKSIVKIVVMNFKPQINFPTNYNNHSIQKPKFYILVPAYNGTKIETTLESLCKIVYANFKIVVIVNGNDSMTYEKSVLFEKKFPELIHILFMKQKGKAKALNYGLRWSYENLGKDVDYVVTFDADAKLSNPNILNTLVKTFKNNKDAIAVSGDIRVVPGDICKKNFWSKLQALEYLISMQIGKRFHTIFNTMLIIPGGFAIFRDEYLKPNPFNESNMTEDFKISLDLHAFNKKIIFEPKAIAIFDCPVNYSQLNRQRIRWSYGQFETLKSFLHVFKRNSNYSNKLKISMANMWFFDVFFNFLWLSFFVVYFPYLLLTYLIHSINSDTIVVPHATFKFVYPFNNLEWMVILFSIYFLLEFLLTLTAIRISGRKECNDLLAYVPLLILFYRPLLRISILKGHIISGILGQKLTWQGTKMRKLACQN